VPDAGELHQLFRDQDHRFGNVEEWSLQQLNAAAAASPGCYVRVAGILVGAGLHDGQELLLAVASRDGLDRAGVAMTLLHRSPGAQECWLPTDDRELAAVMAAQGWRPSTVDLQMRLPLLRTQQTPLPHGVDLAELTGGEDNVMHAAVHELACEAWDMDSHLQQFLDRYVRPTTYDAGLWVLGRDHVGVCGAAIGQVLQVPDALVGKVATLAVVPRARGRGLAAALLSQLCWRFAARGLLLAQLGVNANNRSGAPTMYRHLGWAQASSRTCWRRGDPGK